MMLNTISRNLSALSRFNTPGVGVFRGPWKRFNSIYCSKKFMDHLSIDALDRLHTSMEKWDPQLAKKSEREVAVRAVRTIRAINKKNHYSEENRILFPAEDGCEMWYAQYYEMMYSFMSKQYIIHCKRSERFGYSREHIVQTIQKIYEAQYPYIQPIDEWEIYTYFRMFWVISYNVWPSEKFVFLDNNVTSMWQDWLQGHEMGECSAKYDIPPKVVQCWFNVFKTINSIPKAASNNHMYCSMHPPEYYRNQILNDELWEFQCPLDSTKSKGVKSINEDVRELVYWLGVTYRFEELMDDLVTEKYVLEQAEPDWKPLY